MKELSGNSNSITRDYFDSLLLEQRLMGAEKPATSVRLFGHSFDTPITTAALSHLGTFNPDMESPMESYAKGALLSNTLHWIGMADEDTFDAVMDVGAKTVRIVKPYADEAKIHHQLLRAKERGCVAVGMDIDHTFDHKGCDDLVMGELMSVKSIQRLKEYIALTGLPFVIKGVLSVKDALICQEIGVSAIVVSHHAGRLPYAVPPLMVLPEIRKAVGSQMQIFVDCGILSGLDAYKALALGADAVSVGKHLIPLIRKGGGEAVSQRIREMTDELRGAMAYTGVKDTASFDPSVIHHRTF